MTATMAIRLHVLSETRPLTAVTEWRRRLFGALYHTDKDHSSFNGGPPILTRQYCIIQPPLDIRDEDLMGGSNAFMEAVANLDSSGWNRDGRIRPVTAHRAICLLGPVRDECLELMLGVDAEATHHRIE